MQFTIENIAGGNHKTFRNLARAAKYIANNSGGGDYRIVGDVVTPDSEYDGALAVVRYAASARREVGKDDWEAVVDKCIRWFDSESADVFMCIRWFDSESADV